MSGFQGLSDEDLVKLVLKQTTQDTSISKETIKILDFTAVGIDPTQTHSKSGYDYNSSEKAYEELVNRYQEAILRYCKRLLNFHYQDAEDVASEVFYKAYKNLASFKTHLKFSSWLYRIAHNTCVNLIRDKSKLFFVDLENFWHIPQETKTEAKMDKIELEKVLSKLSSTDRSLLILFHLEEQSLKEISEIFKLPQNTIAVKLKRARERARKFIQN